MKHHVFLQHPFLLWLQEIKCHFLKSLKYSLTVYILLIKQFYMNIYLNLKPSLDLIIKMFKAKSMNMVSCEKYWSAIILCHCPLNPKTWDFQQNCKLTKYGFATSPLWRRMWILSLQVIATTQNNLKQFCWGGIIIG